MKKLKNYELLNLLIQKMEKGEKMLFFNRGGWQTELLLVKDGIFDVKIHHLSKEGNELFFNIETKNNNYGAPLVVQEPSFGIPCDKITDNALKGFIVGALIVEEGKITERFSWSNLFLKGLTFNISSSGELKVNGKSRGFLSLLFLPDKNRMEGYVGVFTPQAPKKIKVVEMEDLLLSQL